MRIMPVHTVQINRGKFNDPKTPSVKNAPVDNVQFRKAMDKIAYKNKD